MQKRLLFISSSLREITRRVIIFSSILIVASLLIFTTAVALAQEGDVPLGDEHQESDIPPEGESPPVSTAPPLDEDGMVVEELMTDLSEDMVEVLDAAAEQALAEENKLDELKMDEMIDYVDLEVTGDARILPDSFLYPFKNIGRGIDTFFTFDPVDKAEKELDYANKKIMESHQLIEEKLVEEKVITEAVAKAVENTIVSAGNDLEDIADLAEKLKEVKIENVEDAPKVEEFLDKIADHTLKQQKVIEKLEEKLPEKSLAVVVEAKEKALEHFGETMVKVVEKPEEITERITKVMDEQEGSDLKDLKNLEVLEIIKEKVPEEAREAIEHIQENRIMVFQEKFKEMPVEVRAEKVDRYLGDMRGNALRQFDMLDDMKRSAWVDEDLIKELDLLKDKMVKKFEVKFAGFEETVMKDQFMGHLMDGDPDDFRTLEQIDMRMGPMDIVVPSELEGLCFDPYDCERYCMSNPDVPGCEFMMHDFGPPPEIREAMQRVHDESVNRFRDRFAGDPEAMKNSEAIQRALENPDAIDFQLLDMVYETMPEDQKRFADELRADVENKMIDMMKMGPMGPGDPCDTNRDGYVDNYEAQQCAIAPPQQYFMMDKFIDPNAGSMEMLARLRDRMPEEDRFYMERAMNEQVYRMDEHMGMMDDQEMFDRMNYQMQEDITVRHEIERRDENFFGDIDRRRMELEREMMMLEEEKMRRMDDMKMEMMRGQREFMPMMGPQPMMMQMGPPPEEMMRMFEEQQRMFQDNMKERGIDPCDFNNDGRVDEYESSQCMMGQQMAPQPDQGFFNRMRDVVPFGGEQEYTDPCDFNGDGYVDLYESKQCAEMGPMEPAEEEQRGFFDRMRDFVPFVGEEQGEPCGSNGSRCSPGDYCANSSNGWCCPHGMIYDSAGPGGCVGEATPQDDRGFFDKFRDFVPFVPDQKKECGYNVCMGGEYCADQEQGWCCSYGTTLDANGTCIEDSAPVTFDFCDFNQDGSVEQSEMDRCAVITPPPPPITGWCGDGRCEGGEYCPQDCEGTPVHGCMGYNDSGACTNQGCVWCSDENACYGPGYSCRHMTECNNNGTCDWNENMTSCPNDCRISDTGCQCSWGWSDNCDCGGGTMTCTSFLPIGSSCNPSNGICCSDGSCSNMSGPGTCERMGGVGGCQCSWGWSESCDCAGPTLSCSSKGGTCCGTCSGGSYIEGTECNCCGTCESESCLDNSWTTNAGACDYTMCSNGCTFDSQGCPSGCVASGGACANAGGICCSTCAGGSYIDGTECNCCETCQGESCTDNSWTTNAGACDYSACPNGCSFDTQGCPSGCMTTSADACDYDGICDSNETPTSCSSDCGTTSGGWCGNTTCPASEYCCGAVGFEYCSTTPCDDVTPTTGCGSHTDSSSCTGGGCTWCEGEATPYSCFGSGHECSVEDAGCECQCGWSDNCDCSSMCTGTNCDGDGVCEWDESLMYCPADCSTGCDYDGTCDTGETSTTCPADCEAPVMGCDYDGACESNESISSCPEDCETTSGGVSCGNTQCASGEMCCGTGDAAYCAMSCGDDDGWTECTTYGAVGDSCDPSVGSCCSPGMCSSMSGPGTCESSSDGGGCQCDWGWSDDCMCGDSGGGGTCGDGACDSDETMSSCPDDCGTAMEGCTCADGFWSDVCDCAGHESMGCDCSCGWSDTCDCWSLCPDDTGDGDMTGCDCGDGTFSDGCCMMRGEYPTQSWLRRVFTFIFGF